MMPNTDQPMHLHRAFGLTIACDQRLSEFAVASPGAGQPDVFITQGYVSRPAPTGHSLDATYLDGPAECLDLNITGQIRFLIEEGCRLTYWPAPETSLAKQRLLVLGTGLCLLLMQRGCLVLHANSVVARNERGAFICVGQRGAGKSTTALAFHAQGFRLLGDDVCALDAENRVLPGIARAKVLLDTARHLGMAGQLGATISPGIPKYEVPFSLDPTHPAKPLRAVFWLVPDETDAPTNISRVLGLEAFSVLRRNVHRAEFLPALGLEAPYMQRLIKLAQDIPVFKITRPTLRFDTDSVVDAIISTYNRL